MARVLAAAIIALVISVFVGPWFIGFLRRNEFGQQIREEMPERHVEKQGTPTMGGLLIVLAATVAFLALSQYTVEGLTVFGLTLAGAGIAAGIVAALMLTQLMQSLLYEVRPADPLTFTTVAAALIVVALLAGGLQTVADEEVEGSQPSRPG